MTAKRNRMTLSVVALAWGTLATLAAASAGGLRINRTVSMPEGVWMAHAYTGSVRRGDAVAICLPATDQTKRYIGPGTCANGSRPLLKTVGAVAGDVVEIQQVGVAVNGMAVPNTAALSADEAGRSLAAYPAGTYLVQPGQIFLFSSHDPRSFDSRYLGPVETSAVIATATPVLVFN